jgi:hypothetical protein
MKGLYLYAVRRGGGKKVNSSGVDNAPVFTISHKEIDAVVSEVDVEKYSSSEIAQKAKEDVSWIVEHANMHEQVIEDAMQAGQSTIPMVFGTIFRNKKNIETVLEKDYETFEQTLKRLTNKQEWGVKVYVDRGLFAKEFRKSNQHIAGRVEAARTMPAGIDYFEELSIEDEVKENVGDELEKYTDVFLQALRQHSVESVESNILAKEITGKEQDMFFNGSFLINIDNISDFKRIVEDLQKNHRAFTFDCTGPWPPYHFV